MKSYGPNLRKLSKRTITTVKLKPTEVGSETPVVDHGAPWATICYLSSPCISLLLHYRQIKGPHKRKSLMAGV